ncbi:MAG: Y-family DNA polymerase [Planctomycetaceae bacterium]|nr:Y-family DNA polymerase [Planctomycetaceae bacterium]
MYALVDCNSFYASCEKVFRPDLADRPVVVLSNNDGCVIAATKDAKALGLTMGVPYFQARPICRKHRVMVFSSNYTLYGDMSRRVMQTLRQFAVEMEIYSIDEAFLKLPEMTKDIAEGLGDHIVNTVKQWTGLPVCVGLGPTKTLAKAANRTAKNRGVRSLKMESPAEIDAILADMPIQDLWGISSRWTKRLNRLGVATALELKRMSPIYIRKSFNIVMERTVRELNGEPCIPLEVVPPNKKQIHVSRSFGKLVTDYVELEQAVATYAARVGEKLRRQNSFTTALLVYTATNRFREQDAQYFNSTTVPLFPATANTPDLIAAACKGLRTLYRKGYNYKKAGVLALDTTPATKELSQGNLFFDRTRRKKQVALMKALDATNARFGSGTLLYASQGFGQEDWRMQRKMQSPHYTTQWGEIPKVG